MKKYILIFSLAIISLSCIHHPSPPTNISTTQQLEGLCKFWGLLKYYHPEVGSGQINWDSVLTVNIKALLGSLDEKKYHELLLNILPPIQESDSLTSFENPFFLNLDLDFLSDTTLYSPEIIEVLHQIIANKTPYKNYYVEPSTYAENVFLSSDTAFNAQILPSVEIRLLSLFRLWNIINYYYPYKYLLDQNWNNVLTDFIPLFIGANDTLKYHLTVRKLVANIDDNHSFATSKIISNYFGEYALPVELKYIHGKHIIFKHISDSIAQCNNLIIGDIINKINGISIDYIHDSLSPLISGSDDEAIIDKINLYLCMSKDSLLNLEIIRGDSIIEVQSKACPKEQFRQIKIRNHMEPYSQKVSGDITYINLRDIKYYEVDSVFMPALDSKVLILDLRENCSFILHDIGNLIFEDEITFYSFLIPNYNFPGVFNIMNEGTTGPKIHNPHPYNGAIIILINEFTQSIGEFTAMALKKYGKSLLIGNSTAGADGNVSIAYLPGQIKVYFTGLGIYYQGFKQTQRVGILPDIRLIPTLNGIKQNNDEVLDFAIDQAKELTK